jgi:hypothetical protein
MMKKSLAVAAFVSLLSANLFATYYVILKNGTAYKAKAKWTVTNGKALVNLENGQQLQLDPALIDEARSEQATRSGLGDAKILAIGNDPAGGPDRPQQSQLGAAIKLRKLPAAGEAQPAPPSPPPVAAGGGMISNEVVEKFQRAYENVGLFEQNIKGTGPHSLRAELTADSEDKVFNAISATSFLMVRNAGVPGADIEVVELFMKTTNGGSSGRFHMTREDATKIDTKQVTQQEYFVRKVLF